MVKYYLSDLLNSMNFRVAKAGYPFIFVFLLVTVLFVLLGFGIIALGLLIMTLFICFFFRDPYRLVPLSPSAIVSPADGIIIDTNIDINCTYLKKPCRKISIFMSIFNVHVNRVPFAGIVKQVQYYPGKYFSANLDKSSEDNERNAIVIETNTGVRVCFVQVAGLIARRIICKIKPGDTLKKGQRFGLICFGSRLDVYIPLSSNITVTRGDRVKAGSSIIGELLNGV